MLQELIISRLTLGRLSLHDAKTAYDEGGSAEAALKYISSHLTADYHAVEKAAKDEIRWCRENNVRILPISDSAYPQRLRHCCDAPMVLFVRGAADLNAPHTLSIVGTRKMSSYGRDCTNRFVDEMATFCPDMHIVSGLAYGVDICAHRAAMRNSLPTIGVIAHGQAMLYPAHHRSDANKMVLGNGAVVTEYYHDVSPEARSFLQRNRIIAGMSDATLLPESAAHGGGLVTARLATDYGREVFAIPGSITAEMSEGPNSLIRDNKAVLVTSAKDILDELGWYDESSLTNKDGTEQTLFTELSDDEKHIVEALKHGDLTANDLSSKVSMPVSAVSATIFALEMKGIIRSLSGNLYHLAGL